MLAAGARSPGGRVRIVEAGAAVTEVDLADFLGGVGPQRALWRRADGGAVLAVTSGAGGQRVVDHRRWPDLALLDRTVFHVERGRWVEAERHDAAGTPNPAHRPIALPRRLRLGAPVARLDGSVALAWAGPARWEGAGEAPSGLAARLEATVGGACFALWLWAGWGEVWLGASHGAAARWVEAAVGPAGRMGLPLPAAARVDPLPAGPFVGGATAGGGLR
jgi:hypothetical protein